MTHSIPWIYLGGLVGGAFPLWSWQLESDGPPREIVGSARRRGAQQSGGPRLSHLAPPLAVPLPWTRPSPRGYIGSRRKEAGLTREAEVPLAVA